MKSYENPYILTISGIFKKIILFSLNCFLLMFNKNEVFS